MIICINFFIYDLILFANFILNIFMFIFIFLWRILLCNNILFYVFFFFFWLLYEGNAGLLNLLRSVSLSSAFGKVFGEFTSEAVYAWNSLSRNMFGYRFNFCSRHKAIHILHYFLEWVLTWYIFEEFFHFILLKIIINTYY